MSCLLELADLYGFHDRAGRKHPRA
jgi:hypothetical protein